MKLLIRAFLFLMSLSFTNLTVAIDLPPEAERDLLITELADHLKNENWQKAYPLFEKVEAHNKKHGFKQDASLFFYKGEAAYHLKKYQPSADALSEYIKSAGSDGKFYSKSLQIIAKIKPELEKKKNDKFKEGKINYSGVTFVKNGNTYSRPHYDRAVELLEPFAEEGNAEAMCLVGKMYRLGGNGLSPNKDKAFHWLEKSAKTNDLCGMFYFAELLTGQYKRKEALNWYIKVTQLPKPGPRETNAYDYKRAHHKAAHIYISIDRTVGNNFSGAVNILKKFATEEKAPYETWVLLGQVHENLYDNNNLPAANYQQAVSWYRKAAGESTLNDSQAKPHWYTLIARMRLARLYLYGLGVEKDYLYAHNLLNGCNIKRAPFAGESFLCGLIYYQGLGVDIEYDKAKSFLKNISGASHNTNNPLFRWDQNIRSFSNYYLGEIYEHGKGAGTEVDIKKAYEHYQKAKALNDVVKKKIRELAPQADELYIANMPYMEKNRKREGVIETESGMQYEYLKKGEANGIKPTDLHKDTVTIHYEISTVENKPLDSSIERNKPLEINMVSLHDSFREALRLMHVGDKLRAVYPYDPTALGFMPGTKKGDIFIFEIELLALEHKK